ncbi:MAG: hypothetical protein LBS59_00115, partial [Puniceicoccales bacterium]|nr:hypothetical protein [Puniceicoccales bacterium]
MLLTSRRTCLSATGAPLLAPAPGRLFGKTPISTDHATLLALDKYHFHNPRNRQTQRFLQET